MRGDQLVRQLRLLQRIGSSRQGLTIDEMAEEEDVSIRTIYRDLEVLQAAGIPLIRTKIDDSARWFFVDGYTFKTPPSFTLLELMSLQMYSDLVRVFKGTPIYDALESLFGKVRSSLPPQTLRYLDRVQSTIHVGIKPFKEYGRFREIIDRVNKAALERRSVEIAYHPLRSDVETVRRVDPYKIWYFEGTIYMFGLCHLRNDVRMFVLDRIRMITVTHQHFDMPADFDLNAFMQNSFKVMRDELHTVRIVISAQWARYMGEKIWHESQHTEKLPDGRLEMTFQVAGLDEIKRWVLSLGTEAEVLEPEALRDMVKDDLKSALDRYEAEKKVVRLR